MELNARLREARRSSGLTLKQVEERSGIGISSISEFESGAREPRLVHLSSLAKVYNRSVSYFLTEEPESSELVLWRQKPESPVAEDISSRFLRLCEEYHMLEEWCHEKRQLDLPGICANAHEFGYPDAEKLAYQFRIRYALGDRPGLSLFRIAEEVCGIMIFHLDFKPTGSAACTVHKVFGPAVLLNTGNVPWRRNFDLAHELFHVLVWRVFRSQDGAAEPTEHEEKLATCFARNLLMPPEVFQTSTARFKNDLGVDEVFEIAREFDVSTEAVVWQASFIRKNLKDEQVRNLINRCKAASETLEMREAFAPSPKPGRFYHLAIKALTHGEISISRFAKLMDISRMQAMNYLDKGVDDGKNVSSS